MCLRNENKDPHSSNSMLIECTLRINDGGLFNFSYGSQYFLKIEVYCSVYDSSEFRVEQNITINMLCHAGLSFRTTEESLRNAFQNFGQLVEGESKGVNMFLFLVELPIASVSVFMGQQLVISFHSLKNLLFIYSQSGDG